MEQNMVKVVFSIIAVTVAVGSLNREGKSKIESFWNEVFVFM